MYASKDGACHSLGNLDADAADGAVGGALLSGRAGLADKCPSERVAGVDDVLRVVEDRRRAANREPVEEKEMSVWNDVHLITKAVVSSLCGTYVKYSSVVGPAPSSMVRTELERTMPANMKSISSRGPLPAAHAMTGAAVSAAT